MAAKKLQPNALECTRAATIAVHAAAGMARGTAAARLIRAAEGLLRSAASVMLDSQPEALPSPADATVASPANGDPAVAKTSKKPKKKRKPKGKGRADGMQVEPAPKGKDDGTAGVSNAGQHSSAVTEQSVPAAQPMPDGVPSPMDTTNTKDNQGFFIPVLPEEYLSEPTGAVLQLLFSYCHKWSQDRPTDIKELVSAMAILKAAAERF